MWHDMFAQQIPFAEKVIRTIVVYLVIALLLRVTGKRGLGSLNTLDIVVMVLISNVVQNAIIGPDNSVTGGVIGAVVLVAINAGINRAASQNDTVGKVFDGTDTTVIQNGEVDERAARRIGLRRRELDHAVRLQNGDDLSQVETGVLDPSGQLLLTLKPQEQSATKGDIARLAAQLQRIESALAVR
ncbi:MAG: hypothetical protein QOG80_31 [Pseudonocardiales bacterium]|nr:hypothetical protein [Pseudonocardiales bacterium]